jgi:transposase
MTIVNHLSLDQLQQRIKQEKDPIAQLRFLAVYHAQRGLGAREIAQLTTRTPRWVHATVQRYNQQGPQALSDRRHTNPGRQPKLRPEETTQVLQALQSPPPDGGLWTGEKLRQWVVLRLGKQLSLNPIYRLLHTAGFRLKVPRPVHRKGDPAAQKAYKKTSAKGSRRRGRRDGRFGSLPMTSTGWD